MAIFYFRPSIIKASSGKSAVASAAYQSAEKLYSERLGKSFSYKSKEEVVHSEILLPENAPKEYYDRQTLWNDVEKSQNKSNSRYARQIIIAIPNVWSREEAIEHSRDYIQKTFVDRGMVVDWAYHEKNAESENGSDNHHLHLMCTVRGFNPDGSWASMEKKIYAVDEGGNRIPEIDSKTGLQKIRKRTRDGHYSEEKIWKRITVQTNDWNRRDSLRQWKKEWAEHCNQYLSPVNQIDYRSYDERGIDRLPMVHEGAASRQMKKRGIITDLAAENKERKMLNDFWVRAQQFIETADSNLKAVKQLIMEGKKYEQARSYTESRFIGRYDGYNNGVPESYDGTTGRIKQDQSQATTLYNGDSNDERPVRHRKIRH